MTAHDPDNTTTIALLGASNLTRAMGTVVDTLGLQYGSNLRIVAALGLGRSYGLASRVLGRGLPAILQCGVWDSLARDRSPPPLLALITDIGNDVMYGVEPHAIVQWIDRCVDRLVALNVTRINITALPIESIRSVERWQFEVVRRILFPTRDIDFETAISHALQTQVHLEELVQRRGRPLHMVRHDRAWYGLDPIHIRKRWWPTAWSRFLAIDEAAEDVRAGTALMQMLRLRMHFPQRFDLFGFPMRCSQPCNVNNGMTVEMY